MPRRQRGEALSPAAGRTRRGFPRCAVRTVCNCFNVPEREIEDSSPSQFHRHAPGEPQVRHELRLLPAGVEAQSQPRQTF